MKIKNGDKLNVVACKLCKRVSGEKGVTLIKRPDSYYCVSCYNMLLLKEMKEK